VREIETERFEIRSPQLRNKRFVDVYLPASYSWDGRRRFPVIYMQDGQNLSDPAIAFGGNTWRLEGALGALAQEGTEAVVVGVHNTGASRLGEYSPFRDPRHGGGRGERYVRFLEETVKPRVDARYRVRRDRDATIVAGSSMGGLISLYAFFRRPSAFGRAAVMSPSIWFGARRILEFVESARFTRGRLYVDVGTDEGAGTLRDARALARILRARGYGDDFKYVEAAGHKHREQDWANRLPGALAFLTRGI
jgi:predicted alpha/beta superfamily hydrolase